VERQNKVRGAQLARRKKQRIRRFGKRWGADGLAPERATFGGRCEGESARENKARATGDSGRRRKIKKYKKLHYQNFGKKINGEKRWQLKGGAKSGIMSVAPGARKVWFGQKTEKRKRLKGRGRWPHKKMVAASAEGGEARVNTK